MKAINTAIDAAATTANTNARGGFDAQACLNKIQEAARKAVRALEGLGVDPKHLTLEGQGDWYGQIVSWRSTRQELCPMYRALEKIEWAEWALKVGSDLMPNSLLRERWEQGGCDAVRGISCPPCVEEENWDDEVEEFLYYIESDVEEKRARVALASAGLPWPEGVQLDPCAGWVNGDWEPHKWRWSATDYRRASAMGVTLP